MIYLDNSATTRPFDSVVEAAVRSMREQYFNASAAYKPAVDVDREIRACRKCIAAQVGAREDEVIFTAGGTESDNLAILGYAMTLHQSANFVVSSLEHPAVGETVQRVRALGHEVRELPIDARGIVDLAAAEEIIDEHTAFVSCMQVSNETGAIQPVAQLSALAKRKNPNACVHVDGVQGFMRVPMHMGKMGVDLYALSGHKIHGPKGVGALIARKGVRLVPQTTGGGQEKNLRSGTYNSPGILALGQAVCEMSRRAGEVEHMRALKQRLYAQLADLKEVRVNGPLPDEEDSAPHILSLSFDGVRGEVMRNALEGAGIYVSTGSACASHKQKVSSTLRAMGLTGEQADGTIRVSLGLFNTIEEMDETAAQMKKMFALLSRYRRR
ncbi:MAG: cysteine desulfurase [Clostridia bacterium]|nr:cysteine desulfurase [Clostridia bacterium]MBQ4609201.1 cysteine desulfurase [Clostridia bacterium]